MYRVACKSVRGALTLALGLAVGLAGCRTESDDASPGGEGTMRGDVVEGSEDVGSARDATSGDCSGDPGFVCCSGGTSVSPACPNGEAWTCPETSTRRDGGTCGTARDTAAADGESDSDGESDENTCGPKPEWDCCKKRDGTVLARFDPECGAPRDETRWSCFFAEPEDAGSTGSEGSSGSSGGSGSMGSSGGQGEGTFTAGDTGNVWTGRCDDADAG